MSWIRGRTIVLSGASSGIGREITLKLIRDYNCRVIGIGKSKAKMKSLKNELSYLSDQFSYHLFDTSIENNWVMFSRYIEENDIAIDILINNAGMMPPFDYYNSYSNKDVDRVMKVNFYSCVYSVRHLKQLLSKSLMPSVINISSASALIALPGMSLYAASKAAIKAYTESLIGELGREMYIGVFYPGFTRTDIFRNQYTAKKSRLIGFMSMRADKMANKIIKSIIKRKNRKVIGKDAKLMSFCSKFFPVLFIKFFEIIMKKSKIEMFDNIFRV